LYDVADAAWLTSSLFLEFPERFDYVFFMPGFYRHMDSQNQHVTSFIGSR
jgi:hypothetical protein